MTEPLYQEIAIFDSEIIALNAQAFLVENGIEAKLTGMETSALGISLDGVDLIKILVPATEVEQARELLNDFSAQDDTSPTAEWTCAACGEQVDAGFSICWNCGQEYS